MHAIGVDADTDALYSNEVGPKLRMHADCTTVCMQVACIFSGIPALCDQNRLTTLLCSNKNAAHWILNFPVMDLVWGSRGHM